MHFGMLLDTRVSHLSSLLLNLIGISMRKFLEKTNDQERPL